MDGWMGGWMDGSQSRVKDCLQQSTRIQRNGGQPKIIYNETRPWLLNRWVDGWMRGLKLNYNGGPFSKMLGFLKIKFLIILKLNYNWGSIL